MHTPSLGSSDAFPHQEFNFQPFGDIVQPLIRTAVQECGLATVRKGTKLRPIFVIWVVLMLTIRRDLNGHQVINWMLSGFRWLVGCLPATSKLVSDGALSHARERVGVEVFRTVLLKLRGQHPPVPPDFHGRVTGVFDGSIGTMPDTPSNRVAWEKSGSSRKAAFPRLRFMCLLVATTRTVWDLAYASYRGKQTGERALMRTIVHRLGSTVFLLLLDAGLYSFEMLWLLRQGGHDVIVKVSKTLKLPMVKRMSDGSFLTRIMGSLEVPGDPDVPTARRQWRTETLTLRAMRVQIAGYRPWTLVTTLLDPAITATEIAQHYHRRWDIEIAYDEIKTHQCATLRGHAPTTFRSKRGDFVEQELYAMVIMYTAVRLLMVKAAHTANEDPRDLSFLDTLHHLVEAAPSLTIHALEDEARHVVVFRYLLETIATATIDRPRRRRTAPRVIKVSRSKFPRKRDTDLSCDRDLSKGLEILVWKEKASS